ncbi:hypothetical protein C9374_007908 [Naegleria lovaniensis]|uniref:Uncharacterized protein n=1 Tax=Naegleria lovaniensis TaxID=51637 RepID=A0AA88KGM9_NAELO|nr:uncharacterized protein C9374_007908 [Naegleria lovaniensis]KAG2378760.1 hypothetical protein C9374_007908 [Naegleria lovaniensis]
MCCSETYSFYFFVVCVALSGIILYDYTSLMSPKSGYFHRKEQLESKIYQSSNGPIQYHVHNLENIENIKKNNGKIFLYLHGTPGGFEEGANFMKACPSDWIIVSPSRIGYGKTNFTQWTKSEKESIDFYFPKEEKFVVNPHAFDVTQTRHLLKIVELDELNVNATTTTNTSSIETSIGSSDIRSNTSDSTPSLNYPKLSFILEKNAIMMMDLMNHLFGRNTKFNIIAVAGGGPYGLELASKNPSRVETLQLLAPVGRNFIIGRGDSPKKISTLITQVNHRQEHHLQEFVFNKKDISFRPKSVNNDENLSLQHENEEMEKKILSMEVEEPKPFNTTLALSAYVMDPFLMLRNNPLIVKFMSYSVVRLMKWFPNVAFRMSVINTEPEMLDKKCFEQVKQSFMTHQLIEGLQFNVGMMDSKMRGYILDLLLFLQFSKDRKAQLESISIPTLIQGSIYDKSVDFEDQVVYIFQHIPKSTLITFGDCGQLFFINNLRKVYSYMDQFIMSQRS